MINNDFITIGGATEDIVFYTNDGILIKNKKDILRQELLAFEQGAKVRVEKYFHLFGGGASNVAVNLSQLGFKTASILNLGKDERGSKIVKNLKNNKVDISLINFDNKSNTGFSFILNNGQDRIIFTHRGANDNLQINNKNLSKIKKIDRIYITSLPKNWHSILNKIFSLNNLKQKIYWNPGLSELSSGFEKINEFIKKTEVLMLNKDEALELVKKSKKFKNKSNTYLNNINNLLNIVKGFGSKNLLITDGSNGAYFFDGINLYHQKALKIKKYLDTTGVGDAFNSTFVALFILTEGDYKKSLQIASRNAISVISTYGAQNGLLDLNKLLN